MGLVVPMPSGDDDSFPQPGMQPMEKPHYHPTQIPEIQHIHPFSTTVLHPSVYVLLHLTQAWPALPWTKLGQISQEPVSLSYSETCRVSSQPPISRNFVAEMATAQESKVIPGKEGPTSHLDAPVGRNEEEEE